MKNSLSKTISASLAAFLLAPTLAQAGRPPIKGLTKLLTQDVQSAVIKSSALNYNVKKGVEQAISKKVYNVDIARITLPEIHYQEGHNHGVFQCITNENIKVMDAGIVQVKTAPADGLVPLAGQDKTFTVSAGDKILVSPTLPFPMIVSAEKFEKLYTPLEGQKNMFALRKASLSPVDVRLFTRDWQPTPTPGYNHPPMYKKGDVLVSLDDGNLRLVMPREEFVTFFHANGDFADVSAKLFKKWGAQDTLKFLGIPTGKPAFYVEYPVRAKQNDSGDWIVTYADGEQAIFDNEIFAREYAPDYELGTGWYKPTGAPQQFIQIKQGLAIKTSWGETQFLRSGDRLNITNPENIYGINATEFEKAYKPVKEQKTTSNESSNTEAVQNNEPGRSEINAWTSLKAFMEVANQHRPYEPWDFKKESFIPDL